eukprot:g4119.t1
MLVLRSLALPYRSCAVTHAHYPTLFLLRIVAATDPQGKRIPVFDVKGSLPASKWKSTTDSVTEQGCEATFGGNDTLSMPSVDSLAFPGRGYWLTCDNDLLTELSEPTKQDYENNDSRSVDGTKLSQTVKPSTNTKSTKKESKAITPSTIPSGIARLKHLFFQRLRIAPQASLPQQQSPTQQSPPPPADHSPYSPTQLSKPHDDASTTRVYQSCDDASTMQFITPTYVKRSLFGEIIKDCKASKVKSMVQKVSEADLSLGQFQVSTPCHLYLDFTPSSLAPSKAADTDPDTDLDTDLGTDLNRNFKSDISSWYRPLREDNHECDDPNLSMVPPTIPVEQVLGKKRANVLRSIFDLAPSSKSHYRSSNSELRSNVNTELRSNVNTGLRSEVNSGLRSNVNTTSTLDTDSQQGVHVGFLSFHSKDNGEMSSLTKESETRALRLFVAFCKLSFLQDNSSIENTNNTYGTRL